MTNKEPTNKKLLESINRVNDGVIELAGDMKMRFERVDDHLSNINSRLSGVENRLELIEK